MTPSLITVSSETNKTNAGVVSLPAKIVFTATPDLMDVIHFGILRSILSIKKQDH